MQEFEHKQKTVLGLDANLAALLCNVLAPFCCIGVILSIIILVQEKQNRFARFYAAQAIFTFLAAVVLSLIIAIPLGFILAAAGMESLVNLVSLAINGVLIALFVYLGINAYQGKTVELPVIGGIAKGIANK